MTAAHQLTNAPTATLRLTDPSPTADVVNVPYSSVRRSALNPRKHFEHNALVELAVNIYERTEFDPQGHVIRTGIEQNLNGRPSAQEAGGVEIAAGERRYRAVALLVEGLTAPVKVGEDANGRPIMGEKFYQVRLDYPMPFRVREMTDAELIETATLENIMRAKMTPMEESDAFMSLIGAGRSIDYIAGKYRMHPATVEGRIQLASGLGQEGRKLLDAGQINLEQAKVIASTTGALKKSLIDHARSGSSAIILKNLLKQVSFPVSNAVFDVEASGLQIEDSGGLGLLGDFPARFRDPKAALNKQLEKLNAAGAEEEATGKWGRVEVLSVDSEYANLPSVDFVLCPDGMKPHLTLICATKSGATARSEIYVRRTVALEFRKQLAEEARREAAQQPSEGTTRPATTPSAVPTSTPASTEKIREAAHVIAHRARAQAIQGKLVTDPHACLALSCAALLDSGDRSFEISRTTMKDVPLTEEARALAADLCMVFATVVGLDEKGGLTRKRGMGFNVMDELLSPHISTDDLLRLWAYLTHQQAGGWDNNVGSVSVRADALAAKLDVKGDVQARFTLTADYLNAYTLPSLLALVQTMPEAQRPVGVFGASKGEVVGVIMEKADALKKAGWVPALVQFK